MPAIPKPKPYADMTLDDVRAEMKRVRERGLQIISNYKRLEQEYSDWEDEIVKIDKIITQMQEDMGLNKQEIIEEKSLLDELLEG